MQGNKESLLLSTLSDLHIAYVGNGATIEQIEQSNRRVRHLDVTQYRFGETFEETYNLNAARYDIIDDVEDCIHRVA